jgi:hypothetical protein
MQRQFDDDDDALDERGILKPGRSIRVRMVAMDSAAIATDGIPFDHHRPGYRFVGDRSAQDAAYNEMVRREQSAWKTAAQVAADTERAAEPPLSEDPREDAYLKYKNWLANAWRGAR